MSGDPDLKTQTRTQVAAAMLLLGQGGVSELRDAGVVCEPLDLMEVARMNPDLGICCKPSGFICVKRERPVADVARWARTQWPDLVARVATTLCNRGEFYRAGEILSELPESKEASQLVFCHAFDFLNAGHPELVESLVFDDTYQAPYELKTLVGAVEGLLWASTRDFGRALNRAGRAYREVFSFYQKTDMSDDSESAWRRVLGQAREFIALVEAWTLEIGHETSLPQIEGCEADALVCGLQLLLRARALAASGYFDKAEHALESSIGLVDRRSLVGALVSGGLFVCHLLRGRPEDSAEIEQVQEAIAFLNELGLEMLAVSVDGFTKATRAFVGTQNSTGQFHKVSCRAEHHGDPLLRAAVSIGISVIHYRDHSFYAALSQLRNLHRTLADMGAYGLSCCVYVLSTLCEGALGEVPDPCPSSIDEGVKNSDVGVLARMVYAVALDVFQVAEELAPSPMDLLVGDEDLSYVGVVLVRLALQGAWPQATALKRFLPPAWLQAAQCDEAQKPKARPALRKPYTIVEDELAKRPRAQGSEGADGTLPLTSETRDSFSESGSSTRLEDPKLEILLLGTFEIRVGGRKVDECLWRRRAGKQVLAALAVSPGHTLSRAELCELIWPDRDYASSRSSLYSVLSSLRETLGCEEGLPAYLTSEQGRVGLNPKLVECDIDIFEDRCREVLSHQGDRPWRLSLCRHLGRLYRGGLIVPAQDVRGDFQAKRMALESLFVDMLVEGATLALKEGFAKEALWFANDARSLGPLREDAVSCHLRALAADGRVQELERSYRNYCTELSEGLLSGPSTRMQNLYHNLLRYIHEAEDNRESVQEAIA